MHDTFLFLCLSVVLLKFQYFGYLMKELTHWKRPWCWERFKAGVERDNRGWNGWMASLTQWIWVWASSKSWWWAGKPGMLQSMGSRRVGHDWEIELNWILDYMQDNILLSCGESRFCYIPLKSVIFACLCVCFNKPSAWLESNFKLFLLGTTHTSVLFIFGWSVSYVHMDQWMWKW